MAFGIRGLELGIWDLDFCVRGLGPRVCGSGFQAGRVPGLGCRSFVATYAPVPPRRTHGITYGQDVQSHMHIKMYSYIYIYSSTYTYIYKYIYIYVCIYIYRERERGEREGEKERERARERGTWRRARMHWIRSSHTVDFDSSIKSQLALRNQLKGLMWSRNTP